MKSTGKKKKVKRIFTTEKRIGISLLLIPIFLGAIFYPFWNEKQPEKRISSSSLSPASLHAKRGFDYYFQDDLSSAIDSFQNALNSDGRKPLHWMVLADLYMGNGDIDLALDTLEEGLTVNPDSELLLNKQS